MQEYKHHRPTAADRLCRQHHHRPYTFRGRLQPRRHPSGYPFMVIGYALAVVALALAVAIISQ